MHKLTFKLSSGKWLALLWLVITITARATDFGDLRVQIENLSPGTHEHGYIEYRATIINRSSQQTHRVTLRLPATLTGADSTALRALTRTIEVAPQSTVTLSLFKPPLEIGGSGIAVLIDGVEQDELLPTLVSQYEAYRYSVRGHLLISPAIKQSGVMLQAERVLQNNSRGQQNIDYEALEKAPAEWSQHWLAYSSYDGVIVTGAEMRAAPANVREALQQYVECGGVLLIFGEWEIASIWQHTRSITSWQEIYQVEPTPTPQAAPEATPTPTPKPAATPVPIPVRTDSQHYEVGFGEIIVMNEPTPPALTDAQWRNIGFSFERTQEQLKGNYDFYENQKLSSLSGEFGTPVRGLFLVMLLFVVVIGPLNLWLLARWRKRLWLLWTVPAISLVTCLAVAGYAIFREGLRGVERVSCMTLLDETAHRATTLGYVSLYSPVTPGSGLHFGTQTELTIKAFSYSDARRGARRSLDWTTDQHLTTGWVAARVPALFELRKSETRRERLTITKNANGTFNVVNGLGANIETLWFADAQGTLHRAQNLAAGAPVLLERTETHLVEVDKMSMRQRFQSKWLDTIEKAPKEPERHLRAGHYLAVLDGAPFIEQGLSNLRERRARTLVYGIPAQP